ncbi:MAG: hypothetical protein U0804_12640 [Gemmataceae bacterium]
MTLPSYLFIHESVLTMDGGTTTLLTKDERGQEHCVRLVQHAVPKPRGSEDEVPGRLYFDGVLVPLRSADEAGVLSLLRSAVVDDDLNRAFTAKVVAFVESDEYLFFADRVEQEKDESRYDVWVVWDDATFGKAVVRVKQVLGVGMKEAREHVQQERPVATGLRAPEVVDWARRFREADLGVRVEPAFRWRLP